MVDEQDPIRREIKKIKESKKREDKWCHIHNPDNEHVGTGVGKTEAEALSKAMDDAEDRKGNSFDAGTFGCSNDQDTAHNLARQIIQ